MMINQTHREVIFKLALWVIFPCCRLAKRGGKKKKRKKKKRSEEEKKRKRRREGKRRKGFGMF